MVLRGAPLHHKLGAKRRWIAEDNEGIGITGVWWLSREHHAGKEASSLVIYMRSAESVKELKMGRSRFFRTIEDEWNRPSTERQQRTASPLAQPPPNGLDCVSGSWDESSIVEKVEFASVTHVMICGGGFVRRCDSGFSLPVRFVLPERFYGSTRVRLCGLVFVLPDRMILSQDFSTHA